MAAPSTYTASTLFLHTLARAGITHAFVNWGSDHPAILEELERQRVESGTGRTELNIVTCPNEMVALSAAQGFAQATGKMAAVIVHVDVGTQVMAVLNPCDRILTVSRPLQAPYTTLIGAELLFLFTRVHLPSVRRANTKERGTSGLCGFRVCLLFVCTQTN
jgi:hypothetical protein